MDQDVEAVVTRNMAVYASDHLAVPSDEAGQEAYWRLVYKCLGLWRGEEPAGTLHLDKAELRLLHGVAKSAASIGKENVGLAWLAIVADGLLHLEAQGDVHQAVIRHGDGVVAEPEPDKAKIRDRLRPWLERTDG